ncbi:hypothetical protein [Alcanivorax jadensis]|uniref:hypothetical protein n=1 Tax=Alcanivorax jadensis TaxID=64988 RepID=UPI0023552C86|nr:hypothetical protein [Alcanivorax jadensis]|tara:strand:- start:31016 stop:31372 length:357 start_codon:yes stop_codon:yes gene_type:complete
MSDYVDVILVIPLQVVEQANRVATVFDPDTGGEHTFGGCLLSPDGAAPATHSMASTIMKPEYMAILSDPEQAFAALAQLAQEYGRAAPIEADVQDFCNNVSIGEPEGLLRIVEKEPAA